mgnify:CR=1 FL=1
MIELGGNITLAGFKDLDGGQIIVVKKMVGGYVRKMSDQMEDFESFKMTMKEVHKTEKNQKYEIHSKLMAGGKPYTAKAVDHNLFVAMDSSLKKILTEISK